MRLMKRLLLIGLALLALGALAYAFRDRFLPAPPPQVISVAATVGDIEHTVLASGTIKPARLVAVGAQASGRVLSLKVTLGQKVAAGDLIAEIDSMTQQNALRTAEANLANIRAQLAERQANLTLAEQTLARQQRTLAQRATSAADFESAEATVKTTRAQIAALEAQIRAAEVAVGTAQVNLGYTRVTAPIDGTVLAIVTQEGQTVNASQSAPTIVVMGQIDVMTVYAEISEADVTRVRPGQPVYFTVLGDTQRRFSATLDTIDPAPESIRSDASISTSSSASSTSSSSSTSAAIYYIGRFNVPNTDQYLRTYMTAQVYIVLGEAKGAVLVPSSALRRGPRGVRLVRVLRVDGTFEDREVQVGIDNRIMAEIRSGLEAGERVVTGAGGGTPGIGAARAAGAAGGGPGGHRPGGGPRRASGPMGL